MGREAKRSSQARPLLEMWETGSLQCGRASRAQARRMTTGGSTHQVGDTTRCQFAPGHNPYFWMNERIQTAPAEVGRLVFEL